jgi:hypothetical protein
MYTHPYLEFDPFLALKHHLDLEIDTDGGDERWGEGVVGVPEEKRRLADAAVPNDQHFEHVIKARLELLSPVPARILHHGHLVFFSAAVSHPMIALLKSSTVFPFLLKVTTLECTPAQL